MSGEEIREVAPAFRDPELDMLHQIMLACFRWMGRGSVGLRQIRAIICSGNPFEHLVYNTRSMIQTITQKDDFGLLIVLVFITYVRVDIDCVERNFSARN